MIRSAPIEASLATDSDWIIVINLRFHRPEKAEAELDSGDLSGFQVIE
jgi:hypothetical protein